MPVTAGTIQDSIQSGADHGPGFTLIDQNNRPLFWFIFKDHLDARAAAQYMREILDTAISSGRSG